MNAYYYAMKLTIVSHKLCWPSTHSPSGYATDGGFPFQMEALSELFEQTTLLVPVGAQSRQTGETPLAGHHLHIVPLPTLMGEGWRRKLAVIPWLAQNRAILWHYIRGADAVHTLIPGDIGTLGLILALLSGKRLLVRHCGNWLAQTTWAERFWKELMERFAGGRRVMLATGGGEQPPSVRNPQIRWIFSTSLRQAELAHYARPRLFPTAPRLIIVCRQEPLKGTEIVIQSLAQLRPHYPSVHLDVVGDGTALPMLKQLTVKLEVANNVTFHGKVGHERVMALLQQADLFMFPTRSSEGFPKSVHEALASGLPVITTRISVLPQLLSQGAGQLVDEATPEAVTRAVQFCLANGRRYEAMSRQALRTAQMYSLEGWRDQIRQYLQLAWGPLTPDMLQGDQSEEFSCSGIVNG